MKQTKMSFDEGSYLVFIPAKTWSEVIEIRKKLKEIEYNPHIMRWYEDVL